MTRSRKSQRQWGRRAFLGGVGAGAMALPFLKQLESKTKAADTFPKRLIVFYTPNGTVPPNWFPTGGETDFAMSRILAPLENLEDPTQNFRSRLIIPRGLDLGTRHIGPGGGHSKGMGQMLTASTLPLIGYDDEGGEVVGLPTSPSVDQVIADHIGSSTAFKSLELGVLSNTKDEDISNRMIFRPNGVALEPRDNPYDVFEEVFGDMTGDPAATQKRVALRRSVIDFARDDLAAIEKRLGAADRQKLEQHKEGILGIEKRLGLVNGCDADRVLPAEGLYEGTNPFEKVGHAQMDMLVEAIACDMTRVASIQWTEVLSWFVFDWIDLPTLPPPPVGWAIGELGHHFLSHQLTWSDGIGNYPYAEWLTRIQVWYAQQFAYLLRGLAERPEGDGSVLDNTVILWVTEVAHGNHDLTNMPFLLAGNVQKADGSPYFRTGTSPVVTGEGHQKLLVSLCQAFGIETDTFGAPEAESGALSALT